MANDEKESSENGSPLAGPALVTIHVASPRGPVAREGARLPIAHTHLSVINTGKVPVDLTGLTLDLLQQSKTGTRVESSLTVGAAPQNLAPGESAGVKISGSIPATPGVYTSTLRIAPAQGERSTFWTTTKSAPDFSCTPKRCATWKAFPVTRASTSW